MFEMPFFNGCDPHQEDPQLDLLNKIGCLPEILEVCDRFGVLLDQVRNADMRRELDALWGEIQVACIESGYAAGVTAARLPVVTINDN